MRQVFESDWLGSAPVFFNEKTGKASQNVNDVLDHANLEFDAEGFNNFLDFGYSVLEQTPVRSVRFLRYSSRLMVDDHGKFTVDYLDDRCPKRRRQILVNVINDRLQAIIQEVAEEKKVKILALEIQPDHLHLSVSGYPGTGCP